MLSVMEAKPSRIGFVAESARMHYNGAAAVSLQFWTEENKLDLVISEEAANFKLDRHGLDTKMRPAGPDCREAAGFPQPSRVTARPLLSRPGGEHVTDGVG